MEKEKVIVEYNGSFWHADPRRGYNENEEILPRKTAKEIWDFDAKKIDIYEKYGYRVFIVWSDDFLKNKEKTLEDFKTFMANG